MNFKENCYWNQKSYGSAVIINKYTIKAILIALGIIIPVIIPIPLMVWVASKIKTNLVWRY